MPEGYLLKPSVQQCRHRFNWVPDIIVGDLGYIHQETKKEIRQKWGVGVVTKLKSGMNLVEPFDSWNEVSCNQWQKLHWTMYDPVDQTHCFAPPAEQSLCRFCWEASTCPKEFWYPAGTSETLLGMLPLNTPAAQRLLKQVRSWIEPTQSYEKNQLGLNHMFLNSLRIAWTLFLFADSVALLRALALLEEPQKDTCSIPQLLPTQSSLPFDC